MENNYGIIGRGLSLIRTREIYQNFDKCFILNDFSKEILNASLYTNKVAASMNIPANMPINLAAPIEEKESIKLIIIIFTMPASPFTNLTAR